MQLISELVILVVLIAQGGVGAVTDRAFQTPKGVSVSGKVSGDGGNAGPLRVLLGGGGMAVVRSSDVQPDGSFEFKDVTPAAGYELAVTAGTLFTANTVVLVAGGDLAGVELHAPIPVNITGRVTVDGSMLSNLPAIFIQIHQAGGGGMATLMTYVGNPFSVRLAVGEYDVVVRRATFGYELKSLMYGSTDLQKDRLIVTDSAPSSFRIVLGVIPSEKATGVKVSGHATPTLGTTGGRNVLLESQEVEDPLDPGKRILNQTLMKADGSFQFEQVPPGVYKARTASMAATDGVEISVGSMDVVGVELSSTKEKH